MEKGSSTPGGRKGVPPAIGETRTPCLQSASRGRWSPAGAAGGQWRKLPNAKRCVLGTAKDLGVRPGGMESLALKWTSSSWVREHLSGIYAGSMTRDPFPVLRY